MANRAEKTIKHLVDGLWPVMDVTYEWDSEDKDFVGQSLQGLRPRGQDPANVAVAQMVRIEKAGEWDNDMIEGVAEVLMAYWKKYPETIGRRHPSCAELRNWGPDFDGDRFADSGPEYERAMAYYAIGTKGAVHNPDGHGLGTVVGVSALAVGAGALIGKVVDKLTAKS